MGGFGLFATLAIQVVELEVRGGELGIQLSGALELGASVVRAVLEPIQRAELIVDDGLVGGERQEMLELLDGVGGVAGALVPDPEIEPGVGEFGIAALDLFQFGGAFIGLAGAQEGESVVEPVAGGIGREREGGFELGDGFVLRGGVLIEGFAEIAMLRQTLFEGGRSGGPQEDCEHSVQRSGERKTRLHSIRISLSNAIGDVAARSLL